MEELPSASGPFFIETEVETPKQKTQDAEFNSLNKSLEIACTSVGPTDPGEGRSDGDPETPANFLHRAGKKRNYRTRSQESNDSSDDESGGSQKVKSQENDGVVGVGEFEQVEDSPVVERSQQEVEMSSSSSSESDAAYEDNMIALSPSIHGSEEEDELEPVSMSRVESSSDSDESDGFPSFRSRRSVPVRRTRSEVPPLVAAVLEKKPKPEKWNIMSELRKREVRLKSGFSLENTFSAAKNTVRRMSSLSKLEHHCGCVNGLHFNQSGTRLASASDDLNVAVWDWSREKLMISFDSGHKANVFQAKFLPLIGDTHIVTAARDGQVRLAELTPSGSPKTRRLAQHKGPCHKISSLVDSPHLILTCAEDAAVCEIDVRELKGRKLMVAKEQARKIPLYSIMSHPLDSNLFLVGGCEEFARVYDRRRITQHVDSGPEPVQKFCPQKLRSTSQIRAHVTSCVYNDSGTEVLATYNDDDIYLFDTSHSEGADAVHRYVGARNSATVKGVNFFGPKSEYIVSGSDCGHIFFWDKESEAIMKILPGDDNGVVNVLEPHPAFPILATSGLDDDVKLWAPIGESEEAPPNLQEVVQHNLEERDNDGTRESGSIDGEMLWMLWRHLNRTERRRRANQDGNAVNDSDASDESETASRPPRRNECAMS